MRKLIITAALATVALAAAAGCADNSPKPSSSASSTAAAAGTTAAAADQTKEVCTEAASTSTTAGLAISAKAKDIAAASGDQAKQLQVAGDLIKLANDWSSKLTELSAKPIKPEVKQALTEGATTITGLTNPAALQSANASQIESQLTALVAKISTACA